MYKSVEKFPDFQSIEKKILKFWEDTRAFDLLRKQNQDRPIWSFLDGPITANNPMGVHHAWGRCLKDVYQRYHAMCGSQLRYQNGFDCQGLWVEVEVEKELGFKSKKDIEKYGMAKFVEACKERVRKFSKIQTEQSIRLGYWMDWDDSYFTMTDENNYTIWSFLKKCHDRGFIYKGFDSMPWCPRCGVGLSQMEMHEGYKWVEHKSVFVRFPIRGREKEAFLVWTTTPWTLTSNVGVAVHPDMTYYKVKAGEWTYYLGAENYQGDRKIEVEEETAKGKKRRVIKLLNIPEVLKSQGEVEVLGELPGKDLIGFQYDGPFDELEAQNEKGGYPYPNEKLADKTSVNCHRAIAWELVTGSEGSGIVHIAPGCGKEDFQLGKELGLVSLSPLDEGGHFLEKYGWLKGKAAHEVASDIVADLKKKGILLGLENYPHRYAHCWRCATPVLYRQVDEWYIDMSWREEIIKTVPQIRWIPEYGEQLELDWLKNMGDWMISKKRYWGLALPIWRCDDCDWFTVIGGQEELQEQAVSGWDEFAGHSPHRPWVDAVKIKCQSCGGSASRIPDVGNPWLDAGIVPYSTMGWRDPEYWKQWFPADLVLECFPGQFRNWFYAMLAMSAMMQEHHWADKAGGQSKTVPPFKALLGHALVRDEEGKEMHKSLGNSVSFENAADTIGAEVMRYMFCCQNPVANLNFPDISEKRKKNIVHLDQEIYRELLTFWNCYSFYITYASVDQVTPDKLKIPLDQRSELDRWILSKFNSLVGFAHGCFEDYRVHTLMERFERFLDNLSNWYIRRSRRRFWKSENDTEKMAAYATLFEILEGTCRMMAPVLPFLTEEIYQNIVRSVQKDAPVSVHLLEYPQYDEKLVDVDLEKRIDTVIRYKNLGLSIRNEKNIKVRQPLSKILVMPETPEEKAALETETLRAQVLEEINVKELELIDSAEGLYSAKVKPNFKVLGKKHGRYLKEIQALLEKADPAAVRAAVSGEGVYQVKLKDQEIDLAAEDIDIQYAGTGDNAVIKDNQAFVALNTNITPELKRESIARDFVRGVQIQRRDMDLHVADRIKVRYQTDQESAAAIQEWSDYVCREILALELTPDDSLTEESGKKFKVGGKPVVSNLVVAKKET
ncbi:isoleucine--tRNA ligase [Myxococcota bacterium]